MLGALPAGSTNAGLASFPLDVWVATPTVGFGPTKLNIDGACTTIDHPLGRLLVLWPQDSTALIDNRNLHISRWEALAELVITSGDSIDLAGWAGEGISEDAPADCRHDGTFTALSAQPAGP